MMARGHDPGSDDGLRDDGLRDEGLHVNRYGRYGRDHYRDPDDHRSSIHHVHQCRVRSRDQWRKMDREYGHHGCL